MAASSAHAQVINPSLFQSLPHDDYGPRVNLTVWTLGSMALAWLGLRIFCKWLRQRRLWWDDYVLVASWVALLGGNISVSLSIHFGFGRHTWDIMPGHFSSMMFVSTFAGSFMIIGAAWSKTSFAITLLRISSGWQKKLVWGIIVSVNTVMGVAVLFTWIRCWPIDKIWRFWIPGSCWPYRINVMYNIFTAAYSGFMDITLALLPWHILWGLSMNKKEKLSALAAMSMGIFAGITSFVKIYAIKYSGNFDIADTVQLMILAAAEISVTIMAASVPILRALARDKIPGAGPFLALDETDRWTRQHISGTSSAPSSPPPPVPSLPSLPPEEDIGIELQPATKKKWHIGKTKVQRMSRIKESEEAESPINPSRPKAIWTPI